MNDPHAQSPSWLKVCITCDRYANRQTMIGAPLADALSHGTEQLRADKSLVFLRVPCLSGCHNPGNIALGAHEKIKIRLHNLTTNDLPALIKLVTLHVDSPIGFIPLSSWPEQLQGRIATTIEPVQTAKP